MSRGVFIRLFWRCSQNVFTTNENEENVLLVFFVYLCFSSKTIWFVKILRICVFLGKGDENKIKDLRFMEFFQMWVKCNVQCVFMSFLLEVCLHKTISKWLIGFEMTTDQGELEIIMQGRRKKGAFAPPPRFWELI